MVMRDPELRSRSARKAPVRARARSSLVEGRVLGSIKELRAATNECRRCPLWRLATQGVPGEGPSPAPLMLVGEQPGDQEDLAGKPFVGPAGAILDRALYEAGIDRETVYVTNAVKHFKFEPRGKRRLHAKPNTQEIQACNWWLGQELEHVKPRLVIALGATAARSVLGRAVTISSVRGVATPLLDNRDAWVTIHPSYLLRIPDEVQQRAEYARFVQELEAARDWLQARPSRESSGP
jgi:uracil-DNA glycosylase family protein